MSQKHLFEHASNAASALATAWNMLGVAVKDSKTSFGWNFDEHSMRVLKVHLQLSNSEPMDVVDMM